MGKTSQPLRILIENGVYAELPEIKALAEAGHELVLCQHAHDLALGGKCWYMPPELIKYLPIALKQARARKRDAADTTKGPARPKAVRPRKARAAE